MRTFGGLENFGDFFVVKDFGENFFRVGKNLNFLFREKGDFLRIMFRAFELFWGLVLAL